jgi:pimeloyl-ACP methyl ester carboxylesterase
MRVLAAVLLAGCIAPQPVLAPPTGDDVTIFLHGYRASFLATESGELAYVTPAQGLSKGDRSLALPFDGQRDFPRYGPLHVVGPLTRLTAIPFIIDLDPYASWMAWAKTELPGFQVFAYDWRRDVRESGRGLCERIAALGPRRRVRLVGHSMGGLVSLACLRSGHEGAQSVRKVAFIGTPFKGGPGQWDDLQLGTPTSSNTVLLAPEALLTFPATWQLLSPTPDFFVDEQGRSVPVPAYDAQSWLDRRWGLFAETSVRENPAYRAQLEARFSEHEALWRELGDLDGPAPAWASLAIVGTGRPTVVSWKVMADGGIDLEHPVKGDGDGTVPSTRAVPSKPTVAEIVNTAAEHSALLNDEGVREAVRQFVK